MYKDNFQTIHNRQEFANPCRVLGISIEVHKAATWIVKICNCLGARLREKNKAKTGAKRSFYGKNLRIPKQLLKYISNKWLCYR